MIVPTRTAEWRWVRTVVSGGYAERGGAGAQRRYIVRGSCGDRRIVARVERGIIVGCSRVSVSLTIQKYIIRD